MTRLPLDQLEDWLFATGWPNLLVTKIISLVAMNNIKKFWRSRNPTKHYRMKTQYRLAFFSNLNRLIGKNILVIGPEYGYKTDLITKIHEISQFQFSFRTTHLPRINQSLRNVEKRKGKKAKINFGFYEYHNENFVSVNQSELQTLFHNRQATSTLIIESQTDIPMYIYPHMDYIFLNVKRQEISQRQLEMIEFNINLLHGLSDDDFLVINNRMSDRISSLNPRLKYQWFYVKPPWMQHL